MASRSHRRVVPPLSSKTAALLPVAAELAARRRRLTNYADEDEHDMVCPPRAHRATPAHALRRSGNVESYCARQEAIDDTVEAVLDFLPMISSTADDDLPDDGPFEESICDTAAEHAIDARRRNRTGGTGGSTPQRGH